ncbi:MAG: hypothetical protein Q9222_006612 [Ikaeria aurantiellina]
MGMDASQWWANVIRSTFSELQPSLGTVPEGLVNSLLHRFSSKAGYRLYDDVLPFFRQLQVWRNRVTAANVGRRPPSVQVGVISNSDDRVPAILASLGLRVNDRRHGSTTNSEILNNADVDWVIMSYEVGFTKPDRRVFDAAKRMSALPASSDSLYLHIGDDIEEDYKGALDAGWQSILLNRDGKDDKAMAELDSAKNLTSLLPRLTGDE